MVKLVGFKSHGITDSQVSTIRLTDEIHKTLNFCAIQAGFAEFCSFLLRENEPRSPQNCGLVDTVIWGFQEKELFQSLAIPCKTPLYALLLPIYPFLKII